MKLRVKAARKDGTTSADASEDGELPSDDEDVIEDEGERIDESESEAAPAAID